MIEDSEDDILLALLLVPGSVVLLEVDPSTLLPTLPFFFIFFLLRAGAALMAAWKDRDGALRLSELDLSRNALGNAVARDLGDALDGGSLVTLKTLRLAWTGLGGEGAAALASGLGGSNVATCDLGWNALRTDDSNGGAPVAARTPNLQHDFNVSVCDGFDATSSAVLRELDESTRSVQKSAESTSM